MGAARLWRRRKPTGYEQYRPKRLREGPGNAFLDEDELPFRAPADAMGVVVTHILELPRNLRIPEGFHLFALEPREGRFEGVPSSLLMHVMVAGSHQIDEDQIPTIRLDCRSASVRARMPLQAADICFQGWERGLVSKRAWKMRTRMLKKAVRHGIEPPVSVVGATRLLPIEDWGTTREEQEAALELSLDESLDFLSDFVLAIGLLADDPYFGPLERGDLPFISPVIVESFPSVKVHTGRSFLREIHDHWPDIGQFPAFPKPLIEVASHLAMSIRRQEESFALFWELFQLAQRTLLGKRTAQAVLAIGTAMEVVVNTVIREASAALGEAESKRAGILRAPFASRVRDHVGRYANITVDLDDPDNVAGAWWKDGYGVRHRVVHEGYRPTPTEADHAFDCASEFVMAIRDGLLSRPQTEAVGRSLGWGRREERQDFDDGLTTSGEDV